MYLVKLVFYELLQKVFSHYSNSVLFENSTREEILLCRIWKGQHDFQVEKINYLKEET